MEFKYSMQVCSIPSLQDAIPSSICNTILSGYCMVSLDLKGAFMKWLTGALRNISGSNFWKWCISLRFYHSAFHSLTYLKAIHLFYGLSDGSIHTDINSHWQLLRWSSNVQMPANCIIRLENISAETRVSNQCRKFKSYPVSSFHLECSSTLTRSQW